MKILLVALLLLSGCSYKSTYVTKNRCGLKYGDMVTSKMDGRRGMVIQSDYFFEGDIVVRFPMNEARNHTDQMQISPYVKINMFCYEVEAARTAE